MHSVKNLLKKLTNKKNIFLVDRGDTAIKLSLQAINKEKILIQDQGGWLSYQKLPNIIYLKTNYGILDLNDLKNKISKDSVLLINSLSGYFAQQPMKEIYKICKQKSCLIINDVSGSIGTSIAKYGDIIIGSFGKWKPINLEYGGFIATNLDLKFNENFDDKYLQDLYNKIKDLPNRLKKLYNITNRIKKDLKNHKIIYKNHKSLVVIVKFKNEQEKNIIIDYCKNNNLQFTLCPKYIRVNEQAISIEVKRG
jgi:hypothetical protein